MCKAWTRASKSRSDFTHMMGLIALFFIMLSRRSASAMPSDNTPNEASWHNHHGQWDQSDPSPLFPISRYTHNLTQGLDHNELMPDGMDLRWIEIETPNAHTHTHTHNTSTDDSTITNATTRHARTADRTTWGLHRHSKQTSRRRNTYR